MADRGARAAVTKQNSCRWRTLARWQRRTFHFARAAAYNLMNIYAIKAACVFMFTTSTIAIYTGFAPRWLAILGYILSLLLLFGSHYLSWSFVAFPVWVLLMSVSIFFDDTRSRSPHSDTGSWVT
jgi:hypothetical protein